jgi:4-amino-4-deoxy-L-arabinose transferase-like glycosyltransferase
VSRALPDALRRPAVAILAMVALAGFLRLLRLAQDGLWVDEAYTALLTGHSFGGILAQLRSDDSPPLFYFLEKLVLALLGRSEPAVRALPLACGIASCLLAAQIARTYLRRAVLPAFLVFAFSSMAVFYSRQGRSYSLLHLLGLCLIQATLRFREKPGPGRGALLGLAALALLYTHNLGLLLVIPAGLLILPLLRGRRISAALAGSMAAFLLAALPWAIRLRHQTGEHAALNAWMGNWWIHRPLALAPLYSLAAMCNGAACWMKPQVRLPGFDPSLAWLRYVVWAAAALALFGGLRQILRRPAGTEASARKSGGPDPEVTSERFSLFALLLFTLLPLAGLALISRMVGPAYVVGRTDILALPAFLLLLAAGWSSLPARPWAPLGTGIWVLAGLLSLLPIWRPCPDLLKASDREACRRLQSALQPGDAVVFGPLMRPTAEYYARRHGFWDKPGWAGSFPRRLDENPAAVEPTPLDSAAVYQAQALALRGAWEKMGIRRVWILALRDSEAPPLSPEEPWPQIPAPPPADRSRIDANAVAYPQNVLLGSLAGLREVEVKWEYLQDWVGGNRLAVCLPRESWAPLDSLPRIEVRR